MLPEGWKNVGLAKLADKISDGIHTTPEYTDETGLYFINGNNIKNGQISIGSSTKSVSQSEFKKHKKDLNDRTLLISINGTIGNIAYYNNEPVILGKSAAYVNVKSEISKDYIYYFLSSEITQKYFTNELTGSTIRNLSLGTIKQTPTPVPPLSEQRRIAEILSTWDRAIALQEQLVANARAQKKALMQTLLTGKKRLPGFKGAWKTLSLSEFAIIIMGSSPASAAYNAEGLGLPLIQGNADIVDRKTAPRMFTTDITQTCKIGDTIFSVRAPVGEISTAIHEACIGRGVAAIRPFSSKDRTYLHYLLLAAEEGWASLSQGSTFQAINSKELSNFEIYVPTSSEEREAIAEAIRTSNELEKSLAAQLNKRSQEKSALMQQLLTGKRRVKVET